MAHRNLGTGVSQTPQNISAEIKICVKCHKPGEFRKKHRKCRECARIYNLKYYNSHKKHYAEYRFQNKEKRNRTNVEISRRKRLERYLIIDKLKSVPCNECGKIFPPYVMDFDHKDPSIKIADINAIVGRFSWKRVLEEINKCNVLCVNCHRMKSWKVPKYQSMVQKLRMSLKDRPCVDCDQKFHYCQMDFDHVRGEKIKNVSELRNYGGVVVEVKKCEIVCANCHRERTKNQGKGDIRLNHKDVNMIWNYENQKNPRTKIEKLVKPKSSPKHKSWHDLVGTTTDKKISELIGISRSNICVFRKRMNISKFDKKAA